MSLGAGSLLDERYLLLQELGRGGTGSVWEAQDLRAPGRLLVGVKLLHPWVEERSEAHQRFLREAEIMRGLSHPNVAQVLGAGRAGDQPYFVMERVQGVTLALLLRQRAQEVSPLPLPWIQHVFSQLAAAVAAAHARGVVHRDLKPLNVMLGFDTRVKVLDFGIAKLLEGRGDSTTIGRRFGSYYYWSPEQARGEAVGPPTDIFALGGILFELLTLRRAWARDPDDQPLGWAVHPRVSTMNNEVALVERIIAADRPRPSLYRPGLSRAVDELVSSALSPDPALRPESAERFAARLEAALAELEEEPTALAVPDLTAVTLDPSRADDEELAEARVLAPGVEPTTTRTALRPPAPRSSRRFLSALVVAVAAGLLLGSWVLARRPRVGVAAPEPASAGESPRASALPEVTEAAPGREPPAQRLEGRVALPERAPSSLSPGTGGAARVPPRKREDDPAPPRPAATAALRRRITALGEAPNPAELERLSAELARLAAPLPAAARLRVERLAFSAAMNGDRAGLEEALGLLERELSD